MLAEIISIGNELLNGNTVNSNATYISKKLHENGIITAYIQVVGDVAVAIRQALDLTLTRSDVILLTGGLGPTPDDITRNVVADYFGCKLVFDTRFHGVCKCPQQKSNRLRYSLYLEWLQENHPARYEFITELGRPVMLNNGIQFGVTYLIMILVLFFGGAGKVSADYWLTKRYCK